MKNKDYDKYNKLAKKSLHFNVDELVGTDEQLDLVDNDEDISMINEIQEEIGNIQKEMGSEISK